MYIYRSVYLLSCNLLNEQLPVSQDVRHSRVSVGLSVLKQ